MAIVYIDGTKQAVLRSMNNIGNVGHATWEVSHPSQVLETYENKKIAYIRSICAYH